MRNTVTKISLIMLGGTLGLVNTVYSAHDNIRGISSIHAIKKNNASSDKIGSPTSSNTHRLAKARHNSPVVLSSDDEDLDEEFDEDTGDELSADEDSGSSNDEDSEDDGDAGEADSDSGEKTILEQLKDNLKMIAGVSYMHLGKQPSIKKIVEGQSASGEYVGIPHIDKNQYSADIAFSSSADLYKSLEFKFDSFMDITHLESGLNNMISFGSSMKTKLDNPRYYLGAKELYLKYGSDKMDIYLGKRVITINNQMSGVSITNLYNTSIYSSFMPVTAGAWQLSTDYFINDDNTLTFSIFPLPSSSTYTPQIFMWGEGFLDYTNFLGEIFSNLGGKTITQDDITKRKYTGSPKQWSYYLGYKGSVDNFNQFLTLYYGLSKYSVFSENKNTGKVEIYRPQVAQITTGLDWKKNNWKLYSELVASYAPNKDDDSYVSGLVGAQYSFKALAKKMGLSMFKLNLHISAEDIFETASDEYFSNKRRDIPDPLAYSYLIGSYWKRGQDRSVGADLLMAYDMKLFWFAGYSSSYKNFGESGTVKTGLRYMYSDNLNITAFFLYMFAKNADRTTYLFKNNSMAGLSLNYQLK